MERILTIYVDPLAYARQRVVGVRVDYWCHMATDSADLEELHRFAQSIGLKREWFHNSGLTVPHYDLTPNKRERAVAAGAVEVSAKELFSECRRGRDGI